MAKETKLDVMRNLLIHTSQPTESLTKDQLLSILEDSLDAESTVQRNTKSVSPNPVNMPRQSLDRSNEGNLSSQVQIPLVMVKRIPGVNEIYQRPCPESSNDNRMYATATSITENQPGHIIEQSKNPLQEEEDTSETDSVRSDESNKIEQDQIITTKTNTAQSLINQTGQTSTYLNDTQSSLGDLHRINTISTSAEQNSQNLVNQSPQQSIHKHRLLDFVASTRKEAYPRIHTNLAPATQNYSHVANPQVSGNTNEMSILTVSGPVSYQDPNERQISIQKTEDSTDQRACPQNNTQVGSAIQNLKNLMKQYSILSERAHKSTEVIRNSHEDPFNQRFLNKSYTEKNLEACMQDIKNITLHKPTNIANPVQITEQSQPRQLLAYTDFLQQQSRPSTVITTKSTAYVSNEIPYQSIKMNAPTEVQNISNIQNPCRSLECKCGTHCSSSVLKNVLLQNKPLPKNIVKRTTGGNPMHLRPNLPVTQNLQDIPSTMQYPFANQFVRPFERSNEEPIIIGNQLVTGNYFQQDQSTQQKHYSEFMDMNNHQRVYPQVIPQNIPSATQYSSNAAVHSCCSCKCSQIRRSSTIIPDHLHQNTQSQETLATEGGNEPSAHQTNTVTKQSTVKTSANVTSRSEHSKEGIPSTILVRASDKIFTEEISTEKLNDANDVASSRPQNVTKDKPTDNQSSPNAIDSNSRGFNVTVEKLLLEQLTILFNKMSLSISESIKMFDKERNELLNCNQMIEKAIESLAVCSAAFEPKYDINIDPSTSKITTGNVQNNNNKEDEYNLDDDDDDDDESEKIRTRKYSKRQNKFESKIVIKVDASKSKEMAKSKKVTGYKRNKKNEAEEYTDDNDDDEDSVYTDEQVSDDDASKDGINVGASTSKGTAKSSKVTGYKRNKKNEAEEYIDDNEDDEDSVYTDEQVSDDDASKYDVNVGATSKEKTKSKKETGYKRNKKYETEEYIEDNDDDEDGVHTDDEESVDADDDDQCKPKKKWHGKKRPFVLPPEYNPKNSRWTLKHRRASAGIVEIMPGSRVYINAIQLENCKIVSKDYKTLAKMLLKEIFKEKALGVCSLTGARSNAFDRTASDVRPGLDDHARTVLFDYLKQYGKEKGWGLYEPNSVMSNLRSLLQKLRTKYKN